MSNPMDQIISRIRMPRHSFGQLKVHCWGGLGSQLFAVCLYYDLKKQFPKRKIVLVLHQGGITKRVSEINGIFSEISTEEIQDFNSVEASASELAVRPKYRFRNFAKNFLRISHVVISLNDSRNLRGVKPWTFSIRGHYSYRFLDQNSVNEMLSRVTSDGAARFYQVDKSEINIGVHYRLGDLINLTSKQPLDVKRLAKVCDVVLSEYKKKDLTVFSDSPDLACKSLKSILPSVDVSTCDLPTWETIGLLFSSKVFVGTFSKVSLWITIFRYQSEQVKLSYLPIEAESNIKLILGAQLDSDRIRFYI